MVVPSVVYASPRWAALRPMSPLDVARRHPEGLAREFKRRMGDPVPLILSGSPYHAARLTALMTQWVLDRVVERTGSPPDGITLTHPANWTEYQLGVFRNALADVGLGERDPDLGAGRGSMGLRLRRRRSSAGAMCWSTTSAEERSTSPCCATRASGSTTRSNRWGSNVSAASTSTRPSSSYVVQTVPPDVLEAATTVARRPLAALAHLRRVVRRGEGVAVVVSHGRHPGHAAGPHVLGSPHPARVRADDRARWCTRRSTSSCARSRRHGSTRPTWTRPCWSGGSSRIPFIPQTVAEQLGIPVRIDAHPKLVVATGAARRALALERPRRSGTQADVDHPSPRRHPARAAGACGGAPGAAAPHGSRSCPLSNPSRPRSSSAPKPQRGRRHRRTRGRRTRCRRTRCRRAGCRRAGCRHPARPRRTADVTEPDLLEPPDVTEPDLLEPPDVTETRTSVEHEPAWSAPDLRALRLVVPIEPTVEPGRDAEPDLSEVHAVDVDTAAPMLAPPEVLPPAVDRSIDEPVPRRSNRRLVWLIAVAAAVVATVVIVATRDRQPEVIDSTVGESTPSSPATEPTTAPSVVPLPTQAEPISTSDPATSAPSSTAAPTTSTSEPPPPAGFRLAVVREPRCAASRSRELGRRRAGDARATPSLLADIVSTTGLPEEHIRRTFSTNPIRHIFSNDGTGSNIIVRLFTDERSATRVAPEHSRSRQQCDCRGPFARSSISVHPDLRSGMVPSTCSTTPCQTAETPERSTDERWPCCSEATSS